MVREVAGRIEAYFREAEIPGVVSAYLFGGHAEGRAHRESDVDVAVLLDPKGYGDPEARFELRVRLISELIHVLAGRDVDVIVLNDVPPELGRKVITDGIRVFSSDDEEDHAYVRDVQLRAADLDPFLRRLRRIKLERLGR